MLGIIPFRPLAFALLCGLLMGELKAAPLTTGNLIIYRVGTGTGSLLNTGNAVFLDEYTPTGVLVQSLALPTAVSGAQKRLVASGTASSGGLLSRSANGAYLVLPGYDATPPHASSLTGTTATSVNRIVGRVDGAGSIDTSTALTDAYDANNFRGVTSNDGSQFWIAGNGSATTGSVRYVSALGGTTSTQLSTTNNNLRAPLIFDGQLYVSSGTGSTVRLGKVGTGLPTVVAQTIATLPGYPATIVSPTSYFLADLQAGVAGVDTLYVADDNSTTGGLLKYSYDGTTWTARGSAGLAVDAYRGLTASSTGSTVTLYAVRKGGSTATGGGELVRLVDTTGSTGTLTGTPTVLATAAANTAFRGVALSPSLFDLSVAISAPTAAFTTASYDYTITLTNSGLMNVANVGAQFTLPSGVSYVAAAGAGFTASHSAGVVTFSGGTVNGVSTATLTVTVTTAAAATISLPAGAVVVDPGNALSETNEANNASTDIAGTVITDAPELAITVAAPAAALTGGNWDYTLTVINNGLVNATAVSAQFTLPAGLSYVSASGSGFTTGESSGVVSFMGGTINAGSSATLTITVGTVTDGTYTAAIGSAVTDPANSIAESNESNNSSTATTSTLITTADLALDLVATGTFQAGESGAGYTITISNAGTGSTSGTVTVSDTLPSGLTATSLTGTGWTIVQGTGGTVSATRSDALASGASYPVLTLAVGIALNAPVSVMNTATVSGGGNVSGANDSDSETRSIASAGPGVIEFAAPPALTAMFTEPRYIMNEDAGSVTDTLTRTGVTAHFIDNPFVSAITGEFNGLITATGATTPSNGTNGFIKLMVTPAGSFTGTMKIDVLALPIAGRFDNDGIARFGDSYASTLTLTRAGKLNFVLALNLDMNPAGTQRITGTLGLQDRTAVLPLSVLSADRAAFDGKTPATSATVATYNIALPAQAQTNGLLATQFPQGAGIGTIKVTKQGIATLSATLADGVTVLASVPLSKALTAPLFAQLYTNKAGSFGGLVTIDHAQDDTDVSSAAMRWFKPFTGGQHYPFGWLEGVTLPLIGAQFTVPIGESVLPDLGSPSGANAKLTLAQGKLTGPVEKEVTISINNVVAKVPTTDASFALSVTTATGRIAGNFTHSDGTRPTFTGIILQKGVNRRAFGHFLTTSPKIADGRGQSGEVILITKYNSRPTLVISEFMAKNVTTIADDDGIFSDWIEIYNPGTDTVNLLDWCLTDSTANLTKWRFPAVTLGAKQFLLVWASTKDRTNVAAPLHTNFALSNGGEYLALVRPDGVTIEHQFAPTFPALSDDQSYGINFTGASLAQAGASARYKVPANDALAGTWTARTFNDVSWTKGKMGIGFGISVPGLKVRHVAASGSFGGVDSIATADALLALPSGHTGIASEKTIIAPTLNFLGEGSDGHYDSNATLPNGLAEPYALKATGNIIIPTAGMYVFGLNSDDGGRIRIDGLNVMVDDRNHGAEDNLSSPVNLTAGSHSVEVIMWEGGGGDALEFFAAAGNETSWSSNFKLVGSAGGLVVSTPPLGSATATGAEVATNVQTKMLGINPSCYVRVPFIATGVNRLSALTLRMRYNDGFVAYLNGVEIARRNAPIAPLFNDVATASRTSEQALVADVIDVSTGLSALVNGTNVLAIHGLNDAVDNGSFLVLPELSGTMGLTGDPVFYTLDTSGPTATPGSLNGAPQYTGIVADTKFSADRGFYNAPFSLAITTTTPGATIRYTLDGSTPSKTHGTVYSKPLSIAKTRIVRAMAYKTGFLSTDVDTQSYFFLNDVISQSASGARPAAGWPSGTINGQVANYGMDPKIVNSTNPEIGGVTKVKQALMAIPSVSIVTDLPNLFSSDNGIWVNPGARGFEWERPASVELIGDKNSNAGGFQINCGIRVRGGFSRSGDNPKHGFHVYFRSAYGASKLNYPLFGNEGTNSFDQIDFRTAQNYSWSFGGDGNNTFLREESTRELQGAMGQPYARGRYYHLYINGQYWGLYNTEERTEAGFSATYLGGNKDNYDVVKGEQDSGYTTGVTDGDLDAWRDLWTKGRAHSAAPTNANYFAMQGKAADGVTATADPVLLDPDNLIDYMLLTFWSGNLDGCTSAFLGDNNANNWFGSRDRTGAQGFKFFAHDFEHTFFNVDEDRTGPFPTTNNTDFLYSNPMFLHHDLRPNAEYKMRWADRVQKHLFNGGALVSEQVQRQMNARVTEVDKLIIAESARWGDSKSAQPYTRQDWQGAVNYVISNYVPNRGTRVLAQLRTDGLYPSFDAPTLSQFGGDIANGAEVVITGNGGQVYYTLDGTDPRLIGGAVNTAAHTYTSSTSTETLIPLAKTWKYLADGSNQGTAWAASAFDDSTWLSGPAELGYGDGDEATTVPFVDVDAGTAGNQKNATTYFRTTFSVTGAAGITAASLNLKVDDGAAVYLNGVEAMRTSNLPAAAAFNQYATSSVPDESAYTAYAISPASLVEGVNTIAVEVHQSGPDSSDISFSLSLSATRTATPAPLYLSGTGTKHLKVRAQLSGEWSALVDAEFKVKNAADLVIASVASGAFASGGTASYSLTVSNTGTAASTGMVTVTTTLPPGLIATGLTGTGWTLTKGTGSTVSAKRSDALTNGQAYPPLTLAVSIASSAPAFVSTTASVAGGGEITTTNNTATSVTPVAGVGASQFQFSAASYLMNEEEASVQVTILRTGDRAGSAGVEVRSSNGTAKGGSDYSTVSQTLTFADAEASQTITVGITNDGAAEPNEVFSLALSNVTGSASLGAITTATVRILDPDSTAPKVTITTPTAAARVVAEQVIINGTTSDNKSVARVQVKLNNGVFADAVMTTGTRYTAALTAPTGANTVTVRAYDFRGNVSNEVVRSFTHVPLRPLALTIAPTDAGTVTITPRASLTSLRVGTAYTLNPTTASGFLFDHWTTPDGDIGLPTLPFTMTEGLAISAVFVRNPFSAAIVGDYNGLIRNVSGTPPSICNNGFLNVKATRTGAFTGTLKIDGDALPLAGQFKNNGTCVLTVNRNNKTPLQLVLTIDLNPIGTHQLTGSVSDVSRDVTLLIGTHECNRSFFDGKTHVAAKANYKVRVPALPVDPVHPPGDGSGIVSIATNGVATCAMKLADNTRFTVSVPMSETMTTPIFTTLYATKQGCFLGTLSLQAPVSNLLSNDALWIKPHLGGAFGFTALFTVEKVP